MLLKTFVSVALPLVAISLISSADSASVTENVNGTVEKLIVANSKVSMSVDLGQLSGKASGAFKPTGLEFSSAPDSFFTILVQDKVLRGPLPGSLDLVAQNPEFLPASLKASAKQLAFERVALDGAYEFAVRDSKTGFVFFNVEGHTSDYDANKHILNIRDGRLLVSDEFARSLGRQSLAGSAAGKVSVLATLYPIEIDTVVNGAVQSVVMKPLRPANGGSQPDSGSTPGPDVIVGDIPTVSQPTGGVVGGFVGIGIATTSCNPGVVDLDWFALPSNDHPVIPQNVYRMSGGTGNNDKFEQIGEGWCKHAFTALTENVCSLGCNGVGGTHLGSGCSDPYSSSLNYEQARLGSRAWINPFTGAYPRGDSATNPNNHTGHTHTGTSHRCLIAVPDLDPAQNPGANYYFEALYVTPHEYVWCQGHAGQCNMYNNASYRRYIPTFISNNFSFASSGSTVRSKAAVSAWTGSTSNVFEPDPGNDGIGYIAYKVTNPSAGVWHYEYAVFNQNLDRGIQSFSVPLGCGITTSNLGFHMPPQHPATLNDGTLASGGYSSTPWASSQTLNALTWNTQTLAQNQNANAIRWGTLYNFRFDSNKPPQAANATLGFFKTGSPITVAIQAPAPDPCNPLQETSAVSRKTQGLDTFDVDLATTECRSGGPTGDYTVVFTFSNNVTGGSVNITQGTGSVSGSPIFSANTMTVNLTGLTDIDTLGMLLHNVQDSFGQTLPDTAATLNVVVGDSSGDGSVNSADISQIKAQSGKDIDGTTMREDLNADGAINSADVSIAKSMSGSGM